MKKTFDTFPKKLLLMSLIIMAIGGLFNNNQVIINIGFSLFGTALLIGGVANIKESDFIRGIYLCFVGVLVIGLAIFR